MGVLIILVILTGAGVLLMIKDDGCYDWMGFVGILLTVLCGIGLLIAIGVAATTHIQIDAQHEALLTQQESIEYKIDSGLYTDDLGLLDKDVVNEAMNWNKDLITYKAWQRDKWIGIFVPNIYDDLELIDYNRIKPEVEK